MFFWTDRRNQVKSMDVLQQIASLRNACVCKQEIRRYIDPLTATLSFHHQFTNAYIICGM
jgi:hypothetical protein